MKTYREADIYFGLIQDRKAIVLMTEFAKQCNRYSFLDKESQEYSQDIESPAFMMLYQDKKKKLNSIIAFVRKKRKASSIVNIVPQGQSHLSMSEYNNIVSQFLMDLRSFSKKNKTSIRIRATPDKITLAHIICGKKSRRLFEKYLSGYPRSYHPSDIARLDDFIRWIACHNGRINLQDLRTYLEFDLKWNKKDASWCAERIETGLDILKPHWRLASS